MKSNHFLGLRTLDTKATKTDYGSFRSEKIALYSITKHDHVDMAVISFVFLVIFFRDSNTQSIYKTIQMYMHC